MLDYVLNDVMAWALCLQLLGRLLADDKPVRGHSGCHKTLKARLVLGIFILM